MISQNKVSFEEGLGSSPLEDTVSDTCTALPKCTGVVAVQVSEADASPKCNGVGVVGGSGII